MTHTNRMAIVDMRTGPIYDFDSRDEMAVGEIDLAAMNVASGLAQLLKVTVCQASRLKAKRAGGVTFKPMKAEPCVNADYVIAIGNPRGLMRLREHNPDAHLFLWLHGLPGKHHKALGNICLETGAALVTASRFHTEEVKAFMRQHTQEDTARVPIWTIPHPIVLPSFPALPYDEDKLILINRGQKDIQAAIDSFVYCRKAYPTLRLHVFSDCETADGNKEIAYDAPGVIHMGPQPRAIVLSHMASAFCLFAPFGEHRETFGFALAQANAVGLPVIAANSGAAFEVVQGDRSQLLDDISPANVLATIGKWRKTGRPMVRMRRSFRLENVTTTWIQALLAAHRREHAAA